MKFLILPLLVFCFQLTIAQKTIYISPGGNDGAQGSLAKPVKTLQEGLRRIAGQQEKDVILLFREGRYYLDTTLLITSELTARHRVTIKNFPGERVIISGSKSFNPEWKEFQKGIFQADLGRGRKIDRLFLNGQTLPMARYPNLDSNQRVFQGTAADALSPSRVRSWRDPVGGYVHALHEGEWGGFHYRITGVTDSGTLKMEGGWQNNRPAPMHRDYRFVENIFEELDAPGEWYYNRATGILYFYPQDPAMLKSGRFEYSRLDELFVLEGTEALPVQNVRIQGLQFTGTNRTFMQTREPLLRTDWTIYRGGAIRLEGTKNIEVTHCEFSSLGGNAIFASNFNRKLKIRSNHIHDIGASAILFIGNPAAVRSPSFQYNQFVAYAKMDLRPGPKTPDYPADCEASDNLVERIGTIEKQVAGVVIDMAARIRVSHNTIHTVPRSGINIGDGCWGGHTIEHNDVFNTVLETGDHGAFNSWGRDRFWLPSAAPVDSMVKAHPEMPFLDVVEPITIRHNRFYCAHGWDIDLDDGSSNYRIYDNLCLSGGLKLREGYGRIVENNILVNNSFHPHVWFANSGDIFRRNIVSAPYAPIGITQWGREVDHNFFLQESALKAARRNQTDAHSRYGDPHFVDPARNNYRVSENSAALKTGFKNFRMDDFGVTSMRLKKLAPTPPADGLKILTVAAQGTTMQWLGTTIKNIEGLAERSAAGLFDEDGILVLDITPGSLADASGLKKRDVIRQVNGKKVKDLAEMLAAIQVVNWQGVATVMVIRDQVEREVVVKLK